MRTESKIPLQKNGNQSGENSKNATSCCGGAPVIKENACCKLDEEKKADGGAGCGCNTSANKNTSNSCC